MGDDDKITCLTFEKNLINFDRVMPLSNFGILYGQKYSWGIVFYKLISSSYVCFVHRSLFTLPLVVIGRLCSVSVVLPGHIFFYLPFCLRSKRIL